MIKWFAYIVLLLILIPCLSQAINNVNSHYLSSSKRDFALILLDSTKAQKQKQQEADNKKKVKELTNAKRLPKPEKVDQAGTAPAATPPPPKAKPKRQRRPQGLERPPELPRRYGS